MRTDLFLLRVFQWRKLNWTELYGDLWTELFLLRVHQSMKVINGGKGRSFSFSLWRSPKWYSLFSCIWLHKESWNDYTERKHRRIYFQNWDTHLATKNKTVLSILLWFYQGDSSPFMTSYMHICAIECACTFMYLKTLLCQWGKFFKAISHLA